MKAVNCIKIIFIKLMIMITIITAYIQKSIKKMTIIGIVIDCLYNR